jgi:hypothetical protein
MNLLPICIVYNLGDINKEINPKVKEMSHIPFISYVKAIKQKTSSFSRSSLKI